MTQLQSLSFSKERNCKRQNYWVLFPRMPTVYQSAPA